MIGALSVGGQAGVLLGNGDGTFQAATVYFAGGGAVAVAAGDFNGDRKPDLVTANYNAKTVGVLLNASM